MSIKIMGSQSLYYNMGAFSINRSNVFDNKSLPGKQTYIANKDNEAVLAWQKPSKEKPETDVAGVVAGNTTTNESKNIASINPFGSGQTVFMKTSSFDDKNSSSNGTTSVSSNNGASNC